MKIDTIIIGILVVFYMILNYFNCAPISGGDCSGEFDKDDFVDAPYMDGDNYIEEGPFVAEDDQEYLSRDYSKIIFSRFPMFKYNYDMSGWDNKSVRDINNILRSRLQNGRDVYWTNQTLSYMRNRRSFETIYSDIIRANNISIENVVDATGNIGGDCISFAMLPEVSRVKVYEILPNVFEILSNNIALYRLGDKITAINGRFDYEVPAGSLVMIDVPYEKGNNLGESGRAHYNLSIDDVPIGVVCNRVLDAGAANILITVPREYKYNMRFAHDTKQSVSVHKTQKNVKIYLIKRI